MSAFTEEDYDAQSDSDAPPRLHGRSLLLARLSWLLIAVFVAGLLVTSIPHAYVYYQSPCSDAMCLGDVRFSLEGASALQARGMSASFFSAWTVALEIIFALVNFAIAAVIFWRKSEDHMALFVSFTLLLFGGVTFTNMGEVLAIVYPTWRLPVILLSVAGIVCFTIFVCVFPDGRFVPRWMRWVVVPGAAITAYGMLLADGTLLSGQTSVALAAFALLVLIVIVVASQVYRYRRVSNSTERQQTKWVVFGFVVGLGGFLGLAFISMTFAATSNDPLAKLISNTAFYGFMLLAPLSIGVAILRSRLYDIDFIIRRTLIYGALTVMLAGAYALCLFVLLNVLLGSTGQTGVTLIVISSATALVIAALSRPLRQRIQVFIDRRFYRRKYHAGKVIAAFGASVRDEVDVESLTARLVSAAREAMQPRHASLSLVQGPVSVPSGAAESGQPEQPEQPEQLGQPLPIDDPLAAYFRASPLAADLNRVRVHSAVLRAWRAAGVEIAAPMISQGRLIGVLCLGARMSGQDYSKDDRGLIHALTAQTAPALRVAQLAREQLAQEEQWARIDQEIHLARQVQLSMLPSSLPTSPGWKLDASHQPGQHAGGDFYDVLSLPDGRIGIAVGNVTDRGMPAVLLLATTRTAFQAIAQATHSPGEVLARVNDLLCRDISTAIFVTCLYAVFDPATGQLRLANAGHPPPLRWRDGNASELRITGLPLGVTPDSAYEERDDLILPGQGILFYTDGILEARNASGDMLGQARLQSLLAGCPDEAEVIPYLQGRISEFAGSSQTQVSDMTMVSLQCDVTPSPPAWDSSPDAVRASQASHSM